jgi:hypothetical protein
MNFNSQTLLAPCAQIIAFRISLYIPDAACPMVSLSSSTVCGLFLYAFSFERRHT